MGPEIVYVSGRTRASGEMNGKSANLNNAMNQIYPEDLIIPANELVCIFDADQVSPSRRQALFGTFYRPIDICQAPIVTSCNPQCCMCCLGNQGCPVQISAVLDSWGCTASKPGEMHHRRWRCS